MARKRKGITPKVRFEVFKRDSFRCQYCGATAPEVILRVDHIKPVAEGGTDELLNLITACHGCNAGKGPRRLDDNSVVAKQRRQIEELQSRREQLEMMLQWRDELQDLGRMTSEALITRMNALTPGWMVSDSGRATVTKWLREHSLNELLDASEASAQHYLRRDAEGRITQESWGEFFKYIPRIATLQKAQQKEPYLKDLLYARAVLRNNCTMGWRAERDCLPLMKAAIAAGIDGEEIKSLSKRVSSFSMFEEILESWIKEAQGEKGE